LTNFLVGLALLQQQPAAEDFYQDFRAGQGLREPMKLLGEDFDTWTKRDEQGLRITLTGKPEPRSLGVDLPDLHLTGDFEITATYEFLSSEKPAQGNGGIALTIGTLEKKVYAKVGRFLRAVQGSVHEADFWLGGDRARTQNYQWAPTEARTGQLRLARKGPTLFHLAADGPGREFQEIGRNEVGDDTVMRVRYFVGWNVSPTPVDARLVDLRIRSGTPVTPPTSAGPLQVRGKGWLAVMLLLALVLFALAVLLFLVYSRRREQTRAAEPGNP
jgi:hypothetical protein